jgi:hypothetical protein
MPIRTPHLPIAAFALAGFAAAQTDLPVQRRVQGHTVISNAQPRAAITFDAAFVHAGSQRFPLYGVADAEQHFFVDADSGHGIRRFYWLQFEHYLPSNDHHYNYSAAHAINIGGLPFLTDTRIYTDYASLTPSPDSDGARARALLSAKGFKLPTAAIRARLIHLPDRDNRSELMIIYLEALAPGQLPPDAKNEMAADDRYPDLAAAVVRHAMQWIKM